jgi:TetR/AcrR family transcriptional repressor of lmrAB and yxaGH operons
MGDDSNLREAAIQMNSESIIELKEPLIGKPKTAKGGGQRDNILIASQRLFRRQGYAATGINDIIQQSGAPRGSLYYYFPAGKQQIAAAAIEGAGRLVARTLWDIAGKSADPMQFVETYAGMLEHWMELSGFRDGCPITTVLLESDPTTALNTESGRTAFASWRAVIAEFLMTQDITETQARVMASFILSTLEGALIQARVDGSGQAIREAAAELSWYLRSRCSQPPVNGAA